MWAPSGLFRWLYARLRRSVRIPTLTDVIVCPMMDDNFQPCVIGFGPGPKAALCTSDGHDIWWLYLSASLGIRQRDFLSHSPAGGRFAM